MTKRLALRPTTLETKNAYPARLTGSRGAKVIRAFRLVSEYGVRPPDTIEFIGAAIDQNGTLILDLRKIRISPKAHSQCRKKRRPE